MIIEVVVPVGGGRLSRRLSTAKSLNRPVIDPSIGEIGQLIHCTWATHGIQATIELDEEKLRERLAAKRPVF